ncbi:hypothetical protein D3C87_770020 [compost metagenome]
MVAAGISVATSRCRNRKITSTTSAMVPSSVSCTSCTASRIEIERSLTIWISTDCGSSALKRGMSARTASTTCTVLALGWRCTASEIESCPLKLLAVLTDSKLSSSVATSSSRTGAPLRCAMISLAKSAAFMSWRLAWMVSVWRGPSSVPTGVLALAEFTALASSSSVMLRALSRSALALMRTAKALRPYTPTCATPSMVESVGEMRFSA